MSYPARAEGLDKKKQKQKKKKQGALGSVVVSKLDKQTCKSEFESHWVPHSFGFVPNLSKKLSKLLFVHWYE